MGLFRDRLGLKRLVKSKSSVTQSDPVCKEAGRQAGHQLLSHMVFARSTISAYSVRATHE